MTQRILQRTPATISWSPVNSDGEVGTDPGTVTVTVTDAAGTALVTDAATVGAGTAARTYTHATLLTPNLDHLTATWEVSNVTVGVTYHDVVGGYYFTIAELRAEEPELASGVPGAYPSADLIRWRTETESSFESWTGMSWVPRFSVVDQPFGETLFGPMALRTVRWARDYTSADTYTELSAGQLSDLNYTAAGLLGRNVYYGRARYGVEHGKDSPPDDLKRRAMRWCRRLATLKSSGLSDRAQSYQTPEGMFVNVGRVGTDWRPTGDEYIDEVLRRPDIDHRPILIG